MLVHIRFMAEVRQIHDLLKKCKKRKVVVRFFGLGISESLLRYRVLLRFE